MNVVTILGRVFTRGRAEALLMASLLIVSLASALLVSSSVGPSFAELDRLARVESAEPLVLKIAGGSLPAVAELRALSPHAGSPPALFVLLAAWSKLSLGRLGLLDPLSAARLPWLLASAFAPLFVYVIVRPSRGPLAAALAGLLLLFFPRWLHAAALGSSSTALAAGWLLVIALYLRAAVPDGAGSSRRRTCWALSGAAALGLAASLSLATLWLVLILLAHHWVAHRLSVRRLVRRGRVPIPATLLFAAPIAPIVFFCFRPELASNNVTETARLLLAVLAPSVDSTLFLGRTTGSSPPLLSYALYWLLWTLPGVIVAAAVIGFFAIIHRALARRFASGRLRPARDRRGLGAVVVIGAAVTLIGPALAPDPMLVFPPRLELPLPFVAIAAALGTLAAARRAAGAARAWLPAAAILAAVAWQTLRETPTLAAFHAPLFGGAGGAMRKQVLSVGDGSELGALAPQLDRLGASPLAIHAPGVPEPFWHQLKRHGRMKSTVVGAAGAAGLRLERAGSPAGRALAVVERDGAALWTLVE